MSSRDSVPSPRQMWHLLEVLHAIVYFAPEVLDAFKRVGLKGFWMGYFASRSAPLGEASPQLVTATFFNFHESMPARALPDAWRLASPEEILSARLDGVDSVLRRILGDDVVDGPEVREAADLAQAATSGCELEGRALFAAHASLPWPAPAHLRLWHAATLLREHRGDGHVAANVANGLDGLAAHVTMCATGAVPRTSIQTARAWSDEAWAAEADRLAARGLLDGDELTATGRSLRHDVEETTDRLAAGPWAHLGHEATGRLHELVLPLAGAVAASRTIPFPNPIGLPDPASGSGPPTSA